MVLQVVLLLALGTATAAAQTTVTATWDRNTDSVTTGYRVYYGTASGSYRWSVDAGNAVNVPVTVSPGSIYYFVVRGYNAERQEGPASAEEAIDLRSTLPGPTAHITATLQATSTALVTWQTTDATTASINGTAVALNGSTSVAITGTTNFTLTAVAADGRTATATATVTAATGAPTSPQGLTAATTGSRATLSWQPPAGGGAPTTYLIDVGSASGSSDIVSGYSVGNVQSAAGDLPRGSYFARIRAANSFGTSPPSAEAAFTIGRRLNPPTAVRVNWVGTTVTISWSASAASTADDVPTNYVLEAGTAPGASNVATLNVGNNTTFRADVPYGSYAVRVRAQNALGDSAPSAEVEVRAPGSPQAPSGLISLTATGLVDLRWTAPAGAPASAYVLEAGSGPGLSDLATLQVGNVTRFQTNAPPGTYYVRVRAVNDRGTSLPSNEIVIRR